MDARAIAHVLRLLLNRLAAFERAHGHSAHMPLAGITTPAMALTRNAGAGLVNVFGRRRA